MVLPQLALAQTNINTGLTGSTSIGSPQGAVTFTVRNNNAGPIAISAIRHWHNSTNNTRTYDLWSTTTQITGAPNITAPTWTLQTTSAPITAVTGLTPVFSGLNIIIPAGAIWRFAIKTNGGAAYYASSGGNIFSAAGVDVIIGNNATSPGYSGTFPNLTTQPRYWCGGITFAPATPCSGTPSAGVINDAPSEICPNTNFTMTVNSIPAANITYQWKSKPVSGTVYANAGTGTSFTTSLTQPMNYYCVVTCTNGNQKDSTPVVTVGVSPFYVCYCKTPLGGSTATSIDSVKIPGTTLNSGAPGSAPGFYTQYLDTPAHRTATLNAGSYYDLNVKYSASSRGSVWLDANRNGTFDNAEWDQINTTGNTASLQWQIPSNAQPGLTGMRIRATTGTPNGATNDCGSLTTGETEDYVVTIAPALPNDLHLLSFIAPLANANVCPYTDIPVQVRVYNGGSNPQSNFSIKLDFTGPQSGTRTHNFVGTLAPFTAQNITFALPLNFQVGGVATLKAYIVTGNDLNPANDTLTQDINIYPAPQLPVAISDTVCQGDSALIYVFEDQGFTHTWFTSVSGGNPVFTGDTLRFEPLTGDTVFYVATQNTAANGSCRSPRVLISAAIGATPVVNLGNDTSFCESQPLVLNAGNPGAMYLWSTNAVSQTITVTSASGDYWVEVDKYCKVSDTIHLDISPLPRTSGISYVRLLGNTYNFSAGGVQFANSYLWLFGDGNTSNAQAPVYTYADSNLYTVRLILGNDCGNDTTTLIIPLALKNLTQEANLITAYPNPATNELTIASEKSELQQIEVYDYTGKRVFSGAVTGKQYKLNTSVYASGTYLLRIQTKGGGMLHKNIQIVR